MPYLLASALSMTLFFGIYWLCLRRLSFPTANRAYLLGALLASLLVPLVEVPGWVADWLAPAPTAEIAPARVLETAPADDWSTASAFDAAPVPTPAPTFDWTLVLGAVLALGAAGTAGRLAWSLVRLARLLRQPARYHAGLRVVPTTGGNASFFHHVLLNEQALTPAERAQVLAHEAEHARRYHSIDRLVVELLLIPFWWNPVLYAYRAALVEVHEWEVDQALTRSLDRRSYATLLLKLHTAPLPLANLLGRRPLRIRIERIIQPQTSAAVKKTAYLLALPVLLVSTLVFGQAPVPPPPPPAPPAPEAPAPEPPELVEEVEPAEPPAPPTPKQIPAPKPAPQERTKFKRVPVPPPPPPPPTGSQIQNQTDWNTFHASQGNQAIGSNGCRIQKFKRLSMPKGEEAILMALSFDVKTHQISQSEYERFRQEFIKMGYQADILELKSDPKTQQYESVRASLKNVKTGKSVTTTVNLRNDFTMNGQPMQAKVTGIGFFVTVDGDLQIHARMNDLRAVLTMMAVANPKFASVPVSVPTPTPQTDERPGVLERTAYTCRLYLNMEKYSPAFLERARQFFKEDGATLEVTNERLDAEGKLVSATISLRKGAVGQQSRAVMQVEEKEPKKGWVLFEVDRRDNNMGCGILPTPPAAFKSIVPMGFTPVSFSLP